MSDTEPDFRACLHCLGRPPRGGRILIVLALLFASLFGSANVLAQVAGEQTPMEPAAAASDPMLAMMYARLERDPNHSDSWRLVGKLEAKQGNTQGAMNALMRALQLDPENAATHFDLGQLLLSGGDAANADVHFRQCVAIAPQSDYAQQLYQQQLVLPPAGLSDGLQPPAAAVSNDVAHALAQSELGGDEASQLDAVGYEIQTFDGADDLDRRLNELRSDADPAGRRWRVFLEMGALYNSNVSLTPISRDLVDNEAESFQGFLNPELEWKALQHGAWRAGPLARGYFTVNESSQSEYDLASFQPGAFIERDLQVGSSDWIARLDHVYSLDLLEGHRLGDRHSLTASVIMIRPDLDVIYTYFTSQFSQFDDDGPDAASTSLDGNAFSGGISRFFQTENAWLPTFSLGIDLESADTEGSDYRYRAINGHGDVTCQLSERWSFVTTVGVGHRDYYDFTGPVSRNELTWRVHGKLRWKWSERFSFAAVVGHDRFASDNEDFDAERTEGGIITTLTY
ncbi:tetratricopeptide repeat protein [Roseimaritima ulvae]|uniref:Tetratricopeptide repeat protein n=1 Tax=Roseimaritima ulvae TaxID=980254 RepID=A0A5B9QGT7_9BACT|nr:tetratricopeptide repeat protein [Roseimaritima ulvae]QEG38317.1 Tetratricopeptide repeat protein [Roseimaritima ulvae]